MKQTPETQGAGHGKTPRGKLEGLALLEMLEILAMGKYTCCVRSQGVGEVYLVMGKAVHGRAGNAMGEEAFRVLMEENPKNIEIADEAPGQQTIHQELHGLLLSCAAHSDENETGEVSPEEFPVGKDMEDALDGFVKENPGDLVYAMLMDAEARPLYQATGVGIDPLAEQKDTLMFSGLSAAMNQMASSGNRVPEEIISVSDHRVHIIKPVKHLLVGLCTTRTDDLELARFLAESMASRVEKLLG